MEFIEGETLSSRLQKGPLTIADLLRYSIQIVDALDKAHKNRSGTGEEPVNLWSMRRERLKNGWTHWLHWTPMSINLFGRGSLFDCGFRTDIRCSTG